MATLATDQKIRIRLKAYDHQLLDRSVKEIVETVRRTGARVSGPVLLPTVINRWTVLRSLHGHRDPDDGLPRLRRPAARVRREEEERVETRGGVVQEGERGSDAGDPRGPAREDREAPGLPTRTGADSRDVRAR